MSTETIYYLLPETVLLAASVAIYLLGAFVSSRRPWRPLALLALAGAAGCLCLPRAAQPQLGPVVLDAAAYYIRWLAVLSGVLLVAMQRPPREGRMPAEYMASLLLIIAGLMFTAAADELVLLFVGLELISIPTYIVLYLGGGSGSREATAKYFYLSILSSAVLLYGLSFLYGAAGSTELVRIREQLAAPLSIPAGPASLARLALVLIVAGLGFRLAAVPFHFYAPDVYQGTSHANAALLSVIPKAAGLVALVRLVVLGMPSIGPYGWRIVLALSLLSMTFGNMVALWQDNFRRLMAYSSIAHAGYMLIGVSVGLASVGTAARWDGIAGVWTYLAVYAMATIGAFATLTYLGRPDQPVEGVDELAGLGRTRPVAALCLAVFLFSLAGLPPLAGFWGKLSIFASALTLGVESPIAGLQPWFVLLAVAGVLNAAIAAAYYLRIVALMYFRTPLGTPKAEGGAGSALVMAVCLLLVIGVGLNSGYLSRQAILASPTAASQAAAASPAVPVAVELHPFAHHGPAAQ